MTDSDGFLIDSSAYQASFRRMWHEGPLQEDPFPMARIANVVTTGHLLSETLEQKQARRRRRRKQRNPRKRDTKFEHSLDLTSVVRYMPASKLNKRKFAAVVTRQCRFTTALIFSTGSIVTVYSKSTSQGQHSCFAYQQLLGSLPQLMVPEETDMASWDPKGTKMPAEPIMTTLEGRMTFDKVWQENIVAYGYLGHPVDLEELYCANPNHVHYEPDQFPGLEWSAKVIDPQNGKETKVKNLIFRTGMWLVTGAQSYGVANEVYYRLRQLASAFHEARTRHLPQGEVLKRLWLRMYEPAVQAHKQGLHMADDLSHLTSLDKPDEEKQAIASKAAMRALNKKLAERAKARRKREKAEAAKRRQRQARGDDDDDAGNAPKKKRRRRRRKTAQSKTATPHSLEEARRQRELDAAYTPLMSAATRGNVAEVKRLLASGEDPAYVNSDGKSILELVDGKQHESYVEIRDLLLAKLTPKDWHGRETGIGPQPEKV